MMEETNVMAKVGNDIKKKYTVNAKYFFTDAPNFEKVPIITFYHSENDNIIEDIKVYLSGMIEFENDNTFEMYRQSNQDFITNFDILLTTCNLARNCRLHGTRGFRRFIMYIEAIAKKICIGNIDVGLNVITTTMYDRPRQSDTKSYSYKRCTIINNTNDPFHNHLMIGHTSNCSTVFDFVINSKGEICFYQHKVIYNHTDRDRNNVPHIIQFLTVLSEMFKKLNTLEKESVEWANTNISFIVYLSLLESVKR